MHSQLFLTVATSLLSIMSVSATRRWCLGAEHASSTIMSTDVKHIDCRYSDLTTNIESKIDNEHAEEICACIRISANKKKTVVLLKNKGIIIAK